MAKVTYSGDGQGNWWRTEYAVQCPETVFLYGQCQGVEGHKDIHWNYAPNGDLNWDDNKNDPQCAGCCGSTPSGHKHYRPPEEMRRHYHLAHHSTEEVTDPEVIRRLEDDDPPEAGAAVTRPLPVDDPMYEECQRRMEEYEREHPKEDKR
jgi:hypothetical protein